MTEHNPKYPVDEQDQESIQAGYIESNFREGDRVRTYDHQTGTVVMAVPFAGDVAVTIKEDNGRERVLFQGGEIDGRPQIEKVDDEE